MAKTKVPKAASEDVGVAGGVKKGGVVKSSQTPKSKSKEIAKAAAKKVEKHKKRDSSDSESEDDSDDSASQATSDSSDSSESEAEAKKQSKAKSNGAPIANGKANGAKKDDSSSGSDSEEDSDSDSGSDDDANVKKSVPAPKANGSKPAAVEEDSEEDDSSESDSDDGKKAIKADAPKAKANAGAKASKADSSDESGSDEDSDGSDDSEDDSDDSDGSDESEKQEESAPKKRAPESDVPERALKKTKVESENAGQSKTLFVGNLPWSVDEAGLGALFEEFGELGAVRLITERETGRSKGFGYVEFLDADDAAKALEAKSGEAIDGRTLNIDFAAARKENNDRGGFGNRQDRAKSYGDKVSEPSATLFVGNISFDADEQMISEAFAEQATVKSVRLPTDQNSGALRGFGYVEFHSIDDATTAFNAMQGISIAGRSLRLDYSSPRSGDAGSPRRGGFGDRGGRGGFGDRGGRGRGGFGDRGGRGRGGFGGGRGDRGGRGGGRGGSTNRGGFGDFKGQKVTF